MAAVVFGGENILRGGWGIPAMKREDIISAAGQVLRSHGIRKAYIFGSFARGERKPNDIDIAIEPPEGKFSLLDLIGLEQEIGDRTGRKADVSLLRAMKRRVLEHAKIDMAAIV